MKKKKTRCYFVEKFTLHLPILAGRCIVTVSIGIKALIKEKEKVE